MTTIEKPRTTLEQRLADAASSDGAVRTAQAAVKAVRVSAREDRHVRADVVDEITAEVLDTGQWPVDAVERLLEARRQNEEAHALGQLLWYVGDKLKRKTDADARDRVGPQVEVLRGELAEVVSRVRELDEVLGGIRTAEQVIGATAAQVEAWTELPALASRWAEVMRLHRLVLLGRDSPVGSVHRSQVPFPGAGDGDQAPNPERLRVLCTREDLEIHLPDKAEFAKMHGHHAATTHLPGVVMHEVEAGSGLMVGRSSVED